MKGITKLEVTTVRGLTKLLENEVDRLFNRCEPGNNSERQAETALEGALDYISDAVRQLDTAVSKFPAETPPSDLVSKLSGAIAFQKQLELGYDGSKRTVEPHSLRVAGNGQTLLYGMRIDKGVKAQVRSYRLSKIESVVVTDRVFVADDGR